MFRKLLFSAFMALALAGGLLLTSAVPGDTSPAPVMSPVPHAQADNGQYNLAQACGPWNNWCKPSCGPWNNWCKPKPNCGPWNNWCNGGGGGGGSACIWLGGVKFCVGGSGSNCHWHNGVKYCNNGGGGGGSCIHVNGKKYCSYKHQPPCVWVNNVKYCRH